MPPDDIGAGVQKHHAVVRAAVRARGLRSRWHSRARDEGEIPDALRVIDADDRVRSGLARPVPEGPDDLVGVRVHFGEAVVVLFGDANVSGRIEAVSLGMSGKCASGD